MVECKDIYKGKESTWKITPYSCLCALDMDKSKINGITADEEDFVKKYDHDRENAPDYGCGDMRAEIKDPNSDVLDYYKISKDDYYIIANEIAEAVSFGRCAMFD